MENNVNDVGFYEVFLKGMETLVNDLFDDT